MGCRIRRGWILGAWLATVVASGAAQAEVGEPAAQVDAQHETDPPVYRELIGSALEEYELSHFTEAKALFLRAHALLPNARTLRVLGMAEFELRDYVAAAEYLRASLASTVRPLDEGMRRSVESLLGRALGFTAQLRVELGPAQAELRVDAQPVVASSSQSIRLAAGSHLLEARAPGHYPETRQVELAAGESRALRIDLAAIPEARRPLRRNPWLWTAVGFVVAGAVAGTLIALERRDPDTAAFDRGTTGQVLVGPNKGGMR